MVNEKGNTGFRPHPPYVIIPGVFFTLFFVYASWELLAGIAAGMTILEVMYFFHYIDYLGDENE